MPNPNVLLKGLRKKHYQEINIVLIILWPVLEMSTKALLGCAKLKLVKSDEILIVFANTMMRLSAVGLFYDFVYFLFCFYL